MILLILSPVLFWYETLKIYKRNSVVVAFIDGYSRSSFNALHNYSIEDIKLRSRWILTSIGLDQMVLQSLIVTLTGEYSPTFLVGHLIFLSGIFLLLDQGAYQYFTKKSSTILKLFFFPLIIIITGILTKNDWSTKLLNDPSFANLAQVDRLRLIEIIYFLFRFSACIIGFVYVIALLVFAFAWINFHTSNKLCILMKRFLKHCLNYPEIEPHTIALHWIGGVILLFNFTQFLIIVIKFTLR
jgi:hypothetical protein